MPNNAQPYRRLRNADRRGELAPQYHGADGYSAI